MSKRARAALKEVGIEEVFQFQSEPVSEEARMRTIWKARSQRHEAQIREQTQTVAERLKLK